jgi:hypothetical protein
MIIRELSSPTSANARAAKSLDNFTYRNNNTKKYILCKQEKNASSVYTIL